MSEDLGPLPEPAGELWELRTRRGQPPFRYYTAEQMRDYAAAAVAAERERWRDHAAADATPRYAIYTGSQSAHCCFDATVVDTTKPDMIGGKHYKDSSGQLHYESVCECFSEEDAQLVRDALNALNHLRKNTNTGAET